MAKKDIILLLSPSAFFALIAIASFFTSEMIQQRPRDDGHKQKFQTFVTNVQSGKWELTTDRWIEGMRRADAMANAYREADASTASIFQTFIWTALAGIALQVIVVVSVLKRARKTMPNMSHVAGAAPANRAES